MHRGFRRGIAALLALALLATSAAPAFAEKAPAGERASSVPVVFDVLVMRPIGLVTLVAGTGLFLVSTPLVLITRPQDIGKPFHLMVAKPAKFVWADPIGVH